MKTFPCLLACSALLTATVIAPAAFAQDPAAAAPGYGYGAPPAAGYSAPAYAAPGGYYLPTYGAPAGYYGPEGRPWAYRDDEGTERRSPAMMITGFTMMGLGVGAVVTGAFAFAFSQATIQADYAAEACIQAPCYSGYQSSSPSSGEVGSVVAMVSGGLLVAVGLPLGIVGASKKPHENQASVVPQVSVGPTGGSARWTF